MHLKKTLLKYESEQEKTKKNNDYIRFKKINIVITKPYVTSQIRSTE